MDKCLAVDLKDPSSIPNQGDFFHLKFFLRGNEPNGEQQQQQQELKYSLVFGRWLQTKISFWPNPSDTEPDLKRHLEQAASLY